MSLRNKEPHFYSQSNADSVRTMQNQEDLKRAKKCMQWSRFMLLCLGLWPHARNNIWFYLCFGYLGCCILLENLDLFPYIDDLEHVIMNLTENIKFSEIFAKLCMLRLYNEDLVDLVVEAGKDFDVSCYRNAEEVKAFTAYTDRARLFIKILSWIIVFTAVSYYFTPIFGQLQLGLPEVRVNENETRVLYILPYRFRLFYPVEDVSTYVMTYLLFLPFPFIASMAQSASDSMMITMVFHLCGQMSMLAIRINEINVDPSKCQDEIRSVVRLHIRLLRMGKRVQQAFSITLLCHLFGATTLICTVGYQLLTNFGKANQAILVKYILFQLLVLMILYTHCFVGEALVTESTKVCEAFYNCKWYNMRMEDARYLIFCIARTQKPLCLWAGKIRIFRLNTVTDVLKASMGYLSVLRSIL